MPGAAPSPTLDALPPCPVCPHACRPAEGARGRCGVRARRDGAVVSLVPGRASGLALDPIEKKPLHHVLPGSRVLSFGTIGCNLDCDFCQNHRIAACHDLAALDTAFSPAGLAATAQDMGAAGVAFTYNEPAVWPEWAVACAEACHAAGLLTVAVTNGYIHGQAREGFFAAMDAANVDLKAFSEDFYRRRCRARLAPVLDTLRWLRRQGRTHLEVTTLVIPGENDGDDELGALTRWLAGELGPDTPLHLSAFHPDHRLRDRPPTPAATLERARGLAAAAGLRYVYLGNLRARADTRCPACGALVIARQGWTVDAGGLRDGACAACRTPIPGIWSRP